MIYRTAESVLAQSASSDQNVTHTQRKPTFDDQLNDCVDDYCTPSYHVSSAHTTFCAFDDSNKDEQLTNFVVTNANYATRDDKIKLNGSAEDFLYMNLDPRDGLLENGVVKHPHFFLNISKSQRS